jgi:sterol desaturase/sphingolipid hydroxylase (fatty acid hydroxylase superfamily)
MTYWPWLIAISLTFIGLERLVPWRRRQPLSRSGWLRDVGFLALNGHFISLWTATLSGSLAAAAASVARRLGVGLDASPVASWPFLTQFFVLLVLADFLQWCVHNLLHRVPWFWTFHKVHHSIETMDWIGNWRFHWMEIVVYRTLQWLPLAWLGASPEAAFAVAVVTTIWGDLNHANLDIGLGPLGYVLNSPRMHLWHHDASSEGGAAKNFGIVFSVWDFLFGTAYWPRERSPERIGYPEMAEMPRSLAGQVLWPLARRRSPAA